MASLRCPLIEENAKPPPEEFDFPRPGRSAPCPPEPAEPRCSPSRATRTMSSSAPPAFKARMSLPLMELRRAIEPAAPARKSSAHRWSAENDWTAKDRLYEDVRPAIQDGRLNSCRASYGAFVAILLNKQIAGENDQGPPWSRDGETGGANGCRPRSPRRRLRPARRGIGPKSNYDQRRRCAMNDG